VINRAPHAVSVVLLACVCVAPAEAQEVAAEPTMQDIEKIVSLDLAVAACSTRLKIEGFRFNRAQNAWRLALASFGKPLLAVYDKRREKGTQEMLRVMSQNESNGCKLAVLKVKDLYSEKENPIVGLIEAKP
jgi:predicted sugar kinase